jgi:hypothetical protein
MFDTLAVVVVHAEYLPPEGQFIVAVLMGLTVLRIARSIFRNR